MKKNLLYLGLTGYLLFALCTRLQAQTDSLQAHRYVTRATMYGVGFTNVFDTYLSPQEYKGIDFRISRETIRMTKLFDGNVSVQNFFQADVGYTHNRADNNNTFSGLVNWNYGLHYQFRLTENFKLLAGGLTSTEDLSTISAIRTIRLLPGHTSIWTLREWLSGI
jgi:hypothetical protein